MQPRRACGEELVAERRDHVEAERADRGGVVPVAFELDAHPARDLRAAGIRESRELREIADRHDARHDRDGEACRLALVDEPEVRIRVVEVLRHRRVRARIDLALEVLHFVGGVARLRVVLGVAGDLDVEPVARRLADERHELVRVPQLARHRHARRQVAAQGDDVADAVVLVVREDVGDLGLRGRDARQVRRGLVAGGEDLEHCIERALLRRAARTEGHREEARLQLRELLPGRAQLGLAFRRLRREELEAEGLRVLALTFHFSTGSGRFCTGRSSTR